MHPALILANGQEGTMDLIKRLWQAFFPPEPTLIAGYRRARERFLLPNEWATVNEALKKKPIKVKVYFQLLFLLGCRRDELRTCVWAHIDLEEGIWQKFKTKNKKRHVLPLSPEAVALFRELPQNGPYVFPGEGPTQPWSRTAVKYWWRKIQFESGCHDVQIRDLRRSTASWMTMDGANLKVVQSMLDHSSLTTTQIYARLDLKSLREALNRHAQRIFGRSNTA